MSIPVKTTEKDKIPKPPRAYPPWLVAKFTNPNAPTPESALEENRSKREPWMRRVPAPVETFGAHKNVPGIFVEPPKLVKQLAKVPVKFQVLNIHNRPIFGFHIRVNSENLITNEQGEVTVEVYQGHDIEFTTGVESGWSFPNGAKRKLKMAGMVPIVQSLPIRTPTKIWLFPESGEYQMNGTIYAQSIN